MMNYDEIIMSLTEIAAQPTEDGMVDGINQQTIRDALELINYQHEHIEAFLKELTPRLLTFKQINGIVSGVVWVELKDRQQVEPWIVLYGKIWHPDYNVGYECWEVCKEDEYNRVVRCWTAKPTEEQRNAVKWE